MSEIVEQAGSLKKTSEKVEFLKKHSSVPFQTVIKYTYDKSIKFLIPDTPPPWEENEYEDEAKSLLFQEARRLKIFVEGGGYDNLNQIKRENLFISLLEDIDNDDAKLLANHMICKKPFKGLSKKVIDEAFPQLINETA